MAILFRSSKTLQASVDNYLDTVIQGVMIFTMGIKNYLDREEDKFEERLVELGKLESKADRLRRNIENDLYSHSLIPEHRGDVLGLLETIDNMIDTAKQTLNQFSVELPFFPEDVVQEFNELAEASLQASEFAIKASRAFFKDVRQVKDHLHKVFFYEKEADKISDRVKRKIFRKNDLDLSQKAHLRYFALHIDRIADEAEDVAERLSIYTIKRSI